MLTNMSSSKREKGEKMSNMNNLEKTDIRIYAELDNKPRQEYSLFDKFSLAVIGACEATNNPHIFLTRANQNIQ